MVAGSESAVAAAIPTDALSDGDQRVLGELLRERGALLLPDQRVEVLQPTVPGRQVLVVVVTGAGQLDDLSKTVRSVWRRWLAPVAEANLAPVRRRAATSAAVAASGSVGQAREMAAVAAGVTTWRPAADRQMAILGTDPAELSRALAAVPDWQDLESTGAGPLPAPTLPRRR